jgi:hypothetical protein
MAFINLLSYHSFSYEVKIRNDLCCLGMDIFVKQRGSPCCLQDIHTLLLALSPYNCEQLPYIMRVLLYIESGSRERK